MPAQRIPKQKLALALMALSEGMATNSVCRVAGISKPALLAWFEECGEACEAWHDRNFRDLLYVSRLQIDEQWAYCSIHKERMTPEQRQECPEKGDAWFWGGMDAFSRAIISWRTCGRRTQEACAEFCRDLAMRVPGEVQVTSDALKSYKECLSEAFGFRLHYAIERKEFHVHPKEWVPDGSFLKKRVPELKGVERQKVFGAPNMKLATVCHIERYFLTMRQGNKRTARKTLAYSKKWTSHAAHNSIHVFLYNMTRPHTTLGGKTPAQALGVTDTRWTAEMVVEMVDAYRREKEERAFHAAFGDQVEVPASFRVQPVPSHSQTVAERLRPKRAYGKRPTGLRWVQPVKLDASPDKNQTAPELLAPTEYDWTGIPPEWVNEAQLKIAENPPEPMDPGI